jgi:hypothetical protein
MPNAKQEKQSMLNKIIFLPSFWADNPPSEPIEITGESLREEALKVIFSQGKQEPDGKGVFSSPLKMSTTEQWLCAATKTHQNGLWYDIGGRIIFRRTTNNYMFDVGEAEEVFNKYEAHIKKTGEGNKYPDAAMKRERSKGVSQRTFEHEPFEDTSYRALAKDISDLSLTNKEDIAREFRIILRGGKRRITTIKSIPITIGAMFIAESARNPLSFLIGLILLDMIEAGIKYGRAGNKSYTWENVLWDPSIINGIKDEAKAKLAGKWPMAHTDSYNEASQFFEVNTWTPKESSLEGSVVKDKECTLLIRWFWNFVSQNFIATAPTKDSILSQFRSIISFRLQRFDLMLNPPIAYPEYRD